MCTACCCRRRRTVFGRNLDLEYAFEEQVAVMPRRFPLAFRHRGQLDAHYAMIGTAFVPDGMPLYYDAVNEAGLAMAGLQFPVYASYGHEKNGVAPFEVIPFVLSRCRTVHDAAALIRETPIIAEDYSASLPRTPMHWFLCDALESVVVEPREDGVHVIDDPFDVLTNSPPFEWHRDHAALFASCLPASPPSCFAGVPISAYSRGVGGVGLPGDWSSPSRFIKATFTNRALSQTAGEESEVAEVFRLLDSVSFVRGSVALDDGRSPVTVYNCCADLESGVYYCKTYGASGVTAVDMHRCDLGGTHLVCVPHRREWAPSFEG